MYRFKPFLFLISTPLAQTKYTSSSNYNGVSSTLSESAVNVGTRATSANLTLQLISSMLSYDVKRLSNEGNIFGSCC